MELKINFQGEFIASGFSNDDPDEGIENMDELLKDNLNVSKLLVEAMFKDDLNRICKNVSGDCKDYKVNVVVEFIETADDCPFEPESEGKNKPDYTPIEELDLGVRSYNCLKRAGIESVEALRALTDDDLRKIRNLSLSCINEIKNKLSAIPDTRSEAESE